MYWFGEEYINSTIVVFENASVHVSEGCKAYLKLKKFSVLTLPSYTPEQNNVDQVFKRLKADLSKCYMSKKRLKYIIAETIMNMKIIILFTMNINKMLFYVKLIKEKYVRLIVNFRDILLSHSSQYYIPILLRKLIKEQ